MANVRATTESKKIADFKDQYNQYLANLKSTIQAETDKMLEDWNQEYKEEKDPNYCANHFKLRFYQQGELDVSKFANYLVANPAVSLSYPYTQSCKHSRVVYPLLHRTLEQWIIIRKLLQILNQHKESESAKLIAFEEELNKNKDSLYSLNQFSLFFETKKNQVAKKFEGIMETLPIPASLSFTNDDE